MSPQTEIPQPPFWPAHVGKLEFYSQGYRKTKNGSKSQKIPYNSLTIYSARESEAQLIPEVIKVTMCSQWASIGWRSCPWLPAHSATDQMSAGVLMPMGSACPLEAGSRRINASPFLLSPSPNVPETHFTKGSEGSPFSNSSFHWLFFLHH